MKLKDFNKIRHFVILGIIIFYFVSCNSNPNKNTDFHHPSDEFDSISCFSDFLEGFTLFICDKTEAFSVTGELYKDKDKILFCGLNNDGIVLFDLSKKVRDIYKISIKYTGLKGINRKIVTVEIIDIISIDQDIIYLFKIEDTFCNEEISFNVVYFVSKGLSCIIGYYLLAEEENIEKIVNPRGNILEGIIDYSNIKFYKY